MHMENLDKVLLKRREIINSTKDLSEKERNEFILEKSKKVIELLRKFDIDNLCDTVSAMKCEARCLGWVKGSENEFIVKQIYHLKFELERLEGSTIYSNDPNGSELALISIKKITISIIEEIERKLAR